MKKSAVTTAARKRADRLASRLHGTGLEQQAAELAEQVRQSEALAKAQAKAEALAKARAKTEALAAKAQAKAEKLANEAQAKAEKLASEAQAKTEKLAAQARRRGTELTTKVQPRRSKLANRMGERLSESRAGKLLGIQRRRLPVWVVALLGIAGGYAIGLLIVPKRHGQTTTSLEETIHSELINDPRTAELPDLKVNVAGGTVFVRGTIPYGFNEDTLREVITRVPGVHDVDLQVTAA
jgi:Tfp pilus assembly protein FimV